MLIHPSVLVIPALLAAGPGPGLAASLRGAGLVPPEEQPPGVSPARGLLNEPRKDFALATDARFLRASDESTGIVGLVRGQATDLPVATRGGQQVVEVVTALSAVGEDGEEVSWAEQPVTAVVQPDGSFLASFGTSLAPGQYVLRVGVLLPDGRGSLVSERLEVPDLDVVVTSDDGATSRLPSVASVFFVRGIESLPEGTGKNPTHAYAAFRLGRTQLIPYFGRALLQSDAVSFFYQVYDLQVSPDSGKADAVVALSLLREGKTPVAQAPERTVTTTVIGSTVGPVPLSAYPPGGYVVQLKVTDRVARRTVVRNERLTILAAEGGAP